MKSSSADENHSNTSFLKGLEWVGAMIAVVAAIMLALNVSISPWAFVLYLISSVLLTIWGWHREAYGIAMQNMIFIIINSLGIYRWLIVGQ